MACADTTGEAGSRSDEHIELSAHRIGVERGEVLDATSLFPAESMAITHAEIARAVAAEVPAESADVAVRMEFTCAGNVINLSCPHPVADVLRQRPDVDLRDVREVEVASTTRRFEAASKRLIQVERDAIPRIQRWIRLRCDSKADEGVRAWPEARVELALEEVVAKSEPFRVRPAGEHRTDGCVAGEGG